MLWLLGQMCTYLKYNIKMLLCKGTRKWVWVWLGDKGKGKGMGMGMGVVGGRG